MKDPRKTAYALFDSMKIGDVLKVSIHAPKKPELFIQMGKDYIDAGGDLEFSGDYSKIRKLTPMSELLAGEQQFIK